MKVLITSGPTREKIDDVRILTNTSSGKMGARIAEEFMMEASDCQVTYVCSETSVVPRSISPYEKIIANSVSDLVSVMEAAVPIHDIVIHPMAVSDFGFNIPEGFKISSNSKEEFIKYLGQYIKLNPKVLSMFRVWNPKAVLMGFKYTSGKTVKELLDIAGEQLTKNGLDFVFANDKMEMKREKARMGYLVDGNGYRRVVGIEAIAKEIVFRTIEKFNERATE